MRKHEQIVHLFLHPTKKKISDRLKKNPSAFDLRISELSRQCVERRDLWLLPDVAEERI